MINRKFLVVVFAIALILTSCSVTNAEVTPVVIQGNGLLPELSIDDKINQAEIIIIGQVESTLPSKWKRQNEKDVKDASPEEIADVEGLFTDSIISIDQIFKGEYGEAKIRVRSFFGRTEQVEYVNSLEPVYENGKTYLIFLKKDIGPTAVVDPGDYISINSDTAVYEIVGDKAMSADDEWVLDELIAYIQKSPLSAASPNLPDTPEAKEIIQVIETAYDVEAEVAYSFNTEKFPSVFVNDLKHEINPEKPEFVRFFINDPALEKAGYLDYKTAYYNWWNDSTLRFEALKEKAAAENREITQEEINSFIDSKWSMAPARAESPERKTSLKFISVDVISDTAVVCLHDGFQVVILYMDRVDGQWYIAGDKENSFSEDP